MSSSWFSSISLPNPFKSTEEEEQQQHQSTLSSHDHTPSHLTTTTTGVKDDLSVLGHTIGRQLRGVAAFLAPPPLPLDSPSAESSSQALVGIRNDLVEIGGSFKSSLSLLSSNKAVSEISRFASNLLQFESEGNEVEQYEDEEQEEDEDDDDDEETDEVVGITDEVVDFVQEISMRPECWTDFPLSLDCDFNMSDAQKEHASTIEHLVPSLAALRHNACKNLSKEKFWMIYFIFLLPRLHEHDAKFLSTPEIVEARGILLRKLRNNRSAPVETSEDSQTNSMSQEGGEFNNSQEGSSSQGKGVLVETVNAEKGVETDHENSKQWLEEEDVDSHTSSAAAQKQHEDEDVSFSDLEDDDNDLNGKLSRFRTSLDERVPSPSGSHEWVRLNENSGSPGSERKAGQSTSREKDSEGEESSGWLTVDEVDLDSSTAA